LKKEVGPFFVNTRSTLQVTTKLLLAMGFQQGEPWNYDPHGIISSKIIAHRHVPYQHQQKAQLELTGKPEQLGRCAKILQVHDKVPE
jgi:hypothetical protein